MDGSNYVDIFATKGIEYLVVIVFLGAFVLFAGALLGRATKDRGRVR